MSAASTPAFSEPLRRGGAKISDKGSAARVPGLDAAPPDGRQIETVEKGADEAGVAHAHGEIGGAGGAGGVKGRAEDFGVGRFTVLPPEALHARLKKFAVAGFAMGWRAEDGAAIGEGRRPSNLGGGEIISADRDGVFGTQTELGAGGVGRQIEMAAKILARAVEKDARGLEQLRLMAGESRALEMREDGGERLGAVSVRGCGHDLPSDVAASLATDLGRRTRFRAER